MSNAITHRVYDPSSLSRTELDAFSLWLYRCHSKVFSGVSAEAFHAYVVEPEALRTRIEVYVDGDGVALGYAAVHLYERHIEGRDVLVVRMETGMDPKFRTGGLTIPFLMEETLRCRSAYPDAEMYYLGCLVSPMSYVIFTKSTPVAWPHPTEETPKETLSLMSQLGDSFALPCPDDRHPLVRDIGWTLQADERIRSRWARSKRVTIQRFLALNPDYAEGMGLLFLMPLEWDLIHAVADGGHSSVAASKAQAVVRPTL